MEGDAWILAMVKISYRFLALAEIALLCFPSSRKNPVQKTWKDMLKNIVKLCGGQFGGKPREIGRCRSIGDWEEKSAEVPGESGWQTS